MMAPEELALPLDQLPLRIIDLAHNPWIGAAAEKREFFYQIDLVACHLTSLPQAPAR
jgi:hypothetical protein